MPSRGESNLMVVRHSASHGVRERRDTRRSRRNGDDASQREPFKRLNLFIP
jgi:hypothetical protein